MRADYRNWRSVIAGAGGLLLATAGPAAATDGMPSNMIFFTDTAKCPAGSSRATQANGRLIVAVSDTGEAGNTVGEPLSDQEDRKHTHATEVTVSLPAKSISGANGPNSQATSHGEHDTSPTTDPASSNLPFIQLLACKVK